MNKTKRILIIDDEIDVLEPVSELLSDEGYMVVTADHASLGAVRAQYVDCIILDLQLSHHNSLEGGSVLFHIWEDEWCEIPIIIFSGLIGIQKVEETLKQIECVCGKGRTIFRCVSKSGGVQPLIDAVNDCFRQRAESPAETPPPKP